MTTPTTPTTHRTPRLLALSSVLAIALLGGCSATPSDASTDADLRQIDVVLDWTPNTNHSGLFLARDNGYFADEGLDVNIIEPGETSGSQLVAAGRADFAYTVSESLVPARINGADIVSIAAVIEHNTSSLISLSATGIDRPRDLAGHSYGSYESPLEKALVSALVTCDGGDPEAVVYAPLSSDDFRIGLTEGHFDTAWVFDAWDTIRLGQVDELEVSTLAFRDYTQCIPDWYTPVVATSATTIADDPELVRSFLAALTRGYQDAMTDPDAAAQSLLEAAPELDPELVRLSAEFLAENYAESPEAWGRQEAATWETFVAFLEENAVIEPGFDTAAAWTADFLPR